MSAPETPSQHIRTARTLADRIAATLADAADGRPVDVAVVQASATLAQAHAQIATAMLLDQATEYGGALKVSAEVDR